MPASPDNRLDSWKEIKDAIDRAIHPFLARYDSFVQAPRTDPQFLQLMEVARDRWFDA